MAHVGHDSEYAILGGKEKRVVPAHTRGFLTLAEEMEKETPRRDEDHWVTVKPQCYSFRDGVALEINMPHGSSCRAGLWEQQHVHIKITAREKLKLKDEIISDPWYPIDLKDLEDAPEDVQQFGCSPAFDPYEQVQIEIDHDPTTTPFRTSGAHLHISAAGRKSGFSMGELGKLAKLTDLLIGLPFVCIFNDDKEFARRELYGKAGEFRPQRYGAEEYRGFEYRVLSPRLYHHPAIFSLLSGLWKYVIGYTLDQEAYKKLKWNKKLDKPLQKAINTGKGALDLLSEFTQMMDTCKNPNKDQYSNDFAYYPKHWGDAIAKLSAMQKEGKFNRFMMPDIESAHVGWFEYNTGKTRWSTVESAHPCEKNWRDAQWSL
jgi:hypothetical protein